LSVIYFFSFLINLLYYYGAMQWFVQKLGWLLQISVGTTAAESMNAASNIFLGQVLNLIYYLKLYVHKIYRFHLGNLQTEAPLIIKPFLS
jgi:pyrimidine nucleoside transport protein